MEGVGTKRWKFDLFLEQQANDAWCVFENKLVKDAEQIQCVVSNNLIAQSVAFGKTQQPNLWDYADNIDTLAFLSKK